MTVSSPEISMEDKEFDMIHHGFYGVVRKLYSGTSAYSTYRLHPLNKRPDPEDQKEFEDKWRRDHNYYGRGAGLRNQRNTSPAMEMPSGNCMVM